MGGAALALTGVPHGNRSLLVQDIFIYGALRHLPLLAAVLGHDRARPVPAHLPGHGVRRGAWDMLPVPVEVPGAALPGFLLHGMTEADFARIDWYEASFGYRRDEVSVIAGDGAPVRAVVWFPPDRAAGGSAQAEDWALGPWVEAHGAVMVEAAHDGMAAWARGSSAVEVGARWPQIAVRAASRLRARADTGPCDLRRQAGPGDVAVTTLDEPYARFFAVEEVGLRLRRFAGGVNAPIQRAGFVIGDAVTVLPYDPARDRVLLVEQFRTGPHLRGDPQPWSLEPVAGRIDPYETPQDAARREAVEEAGIALDRLVPVAEYYPSPGAVTEYLYSYVGLADLPVAGDWLAGVEAEGEDIRAHVIGFDRLMALVASGEVRNAPLLISALWLSQARDGLRRAG